MEGQRRWTGRYVERDGEKEGGTVRGEDEILYVKNVRVPWGWMRTNALPHSLPPSPPPSLPSRQPCTWQAWACLRHEQELQ
jgi:hypothetical protein